jgi:hypothetical protein
VLYGPAAGVLLISERRFEKNERRFEKFKGMKKGRLKPFERLFFTW